MNSFSVVMAAAVALAAPAQARSATLASPAQGNPDALAAVNALLAQDRAFATAASKAADPAQALAPMLDADAAMAVAGVQHRGRDAVVQALKASTNFNKGAVGWAPIRGIISADGTHGVTYGYLTVTGGDPARKDRKYLSYWVNGPEGWRVAAYRQGFREAGAQTAAMAPSVPPKLVRPAADAKKIDAYKKSLMAAEQAFSDHAQKAGRRAAFHKVTASDGMLMGGKSEFLIGKEAVSGTFPAGESSSPLRWSTDRALVASSGDLGLSIGSLRFNQKAEGQPQSIPFFTVWRRADPTKPWELIAE